MRAWVDSLGRRIRKDLADNVQVLVPEGAHDNYFVCHTNWSVCGRKEGESVWVVNVDLTRLLAW